MNHHMLVVARVLHVLGVVVWIGGVFFVTTVLLPYVKALKTDDPAALFEKIEDRFSKYAKISVALTGISGFYMIDVMNLWSRFADIRFWWMHAMVFVWLVFSVILMVVEPVLRKKMERNELEIAPETFIRTASRVHFVLLIVSMLTIVGAAAGSHGLLL